MMAHALGTNHRLWDPQISALEGSYSLLRYDWRGHGSTDAPPGPYSLAQFEADAVGLMDALELERVNWVGISTGAMIGQGLAINYPRRIQTLTLCNTTAQFGPWYAAWAAERHALIEREGLAPVWRQSERMWFNSAFIESEGPAYRAVREMFFGNTTHGYLAAVDAVAQLAYLTELDRVRCPAAIIAAADDPVTTLEQAEAMRGKIEHCALTVLDGLLHLSNVEAPQRFNAALCTELARMIEATAND